MSDSIHQWGPPVATAFISWLLSVLYTRRKASETLVSTVLEGIIERIEKVAQDASLYYASTINENSRSREIIIQHQIGSISREINDICSKKTILPKDGVSPKTRMINFRKTVTGGSFRANGRQPLPLESHLYVLISTHRDELISTLREIQFGK